MTKPMKELRSKSMKDNEITEEVAKGAGKAFAFIFTQLLRLLYLWAGLWLLTRFDLIPI